MRFELALLPPTFHRARMDIEPFDNLPIGVMIEQAVDLIDNGLIGLAQLPARLGQLQIQATRLAATETDVNVDLLGFE